MGAIAMSDQIREPGLTLLRRIVQALFPRRDAAESRFRQTLGGTVGESRGGQMLREPAERARTTLIQQRKPACGVVEWHELGKCTDSPRPIPMEFLDTHAGNWVLLLADSRKPM